MSDGVLVQMGQGHTNVTFEQWPKESEGEIHVDYWENTAGNCKGSDMISVYECIKHPLNIQWVYVK